jgi:hypothetical protein
VRVDGTTLDRAWLVVRYRAITRRIERAERERPQRAWTAIDFDTLDELRAEAACIVLQLVNDDMRGGE